MGGVQADHVQSRPTAVSRRVGRYEIIAELGRGGMAIVYLARQLDLDRFVALKELSAFHAADEEFLHRFLREARLAGSLAHPNIVTVHDAFEHDGLPYLSMEYVRGGSLRASIGKLTFVQIAGALEGVLAGLAHAESAGIVHRDLKPENLMVTDEGRIKIADFGIAKAVNRLTTAFMTRPGTTVGTPQYMAPEQALGQPVTAATDLYAVGVIAYELLSGAPPFGGADSEPMAVMLRQVNDPPPALTLTPGMPVAVVPWVMRLLEKDPRQRYASASDAWDAFENIVLEHAGPRWRRGARLPVAGQEKSGASPLTPAAFAHAGTRPASDLDEPGTDEAPTDAQSSEEYVSFVWPDPAVPPRDPGAVPATGDQEAAPATPGESSPPPAAPPEGTTPLPVAPAQFTPRGPLTSPAQTPTAPVPDPAVTLTPRRPPPRAEPPAFPHRRRAGRRRAALVVGTVLVAGAIGAAVLTVPGDDSRAPRTPTLPQRTVATLSNGELRLSFSPPWREADHGTAPAIDGLSLSRQLVLTRVDASPAWLYAGRVEAAGPLLVPASFVRALHDPLPEPRTFAVGALRGLLYTDVLAGDQRLTVFAAPSTAGVMTVVCAAPAKSALTCRDVLATLRLLEGEPLAPNAAPEFAGFLSRALAPLRSPRERALARLRAATTQSAQASAARDLARAFATARRRLRSADVSPWDAAVHRSIRIAAGEARQGYLRMASAASRGSAGGFGTARRSALAGELALRRALRALNALGYELLAADRSATGIAVADVRRVSALPSLKRAAPPSVAPSVPAPTASPSPPARGEPAPTPAPRPTQPPAPERGQSGGGEG